MSGSVSLQPIEKKTKVPFKLQRKHLMLVPLMRQVRGYLESVYNVSSQPEEYVKYRLHLVTRLEMRQINDWFHNRWGLLALLNPSENISFERSVSRCPAAPAGVGGCGKTMTGFRTGVVA